MAESSQSDSPTSPPRQRDSRLQRLAIGSHQRQGRIVHLDDRQHHYLTRVLRLQSGDRFIAITPGSGWWLAQLDSDGTAELLEPVTVQTELPIAVTLMIAMPKAGMDDIVRQATELGVAAIQPITSDRTLLKPSSQKLTRWQRITQEATEQSERQQVPPIHAPLSFPQALATTDSAAHRWIGVTHQTAPHLLTVAQPLQDSRSMVQPPACCLAIGPEGGWTAAEVEQAIATGFQPISLGERILRAVTAPIAALSILSAIVEAD